jgi:hypothetical protein
VRAGLYCTGEPPTQLKIAKIWAKRVPSLAFQRDYLSELRRLARNDPDPRFVGEQYRQRINELQKRSTLKPEDQVDLSFYLIRLGQPGEALKVLRSADGPGPHRFMVLANLATAHQMLASAGDNPKLNLSSARYYLKRALKPGTWPKEWPAWKPEQLRWYREAEDVHLKLVELRLAEVIKGPGVSRPFANVDALFPINFSVEKGSYRSGQAPTGQEGKLKGNEIAIVQQLLTWLPTDNRLYWLLGELENAAGDVVSAARILDDCVYNQNMSADLLKEHWNILRQAAAEVARNAPAETPMPSQPKEDAGWMPDIWQMAVVGGIGGLIVLIMAYFQIREIRRRRHRKAPGSAVRPST